MAGWRTVEARREWTFQHPWFTAVVYGFIIEVPVGVWLLAVTQNVAALVVVGVVTFTPAVIAMAPVVKRNARGWSR